MLALLIFLGTVQIVCALSWNLRPMKSCAQCPFDTCAKGEGTNYSAIFPGLFVNTKDFGDYRKFSRNENTYNMTKYRVISKYIDLALPQSIFAASHSRKVQSSCCETKLQIIVPMTVEHMDITYTVTHFRHSFQLLTRGICSSNSAMCGGCVQEKKFQWVLINDSDYDPPVRFVPVSYPSHCTCVNIGDEDSMTDFDVNLNINEIYTE